MPVRARTVILSALWWLGAASLASAQVPAGGAADSLGSAVRRLTARIDSLESGLCPDISTIVLPAPTGVSRTDSLIAALGALERRLRGLRDARCPSAAPAAPAAPADTSDELAALRAAAAAATGAEPGAPAATPADTVRRAPQPAAATPARSANTLNPEISATGDIRLVAREGRQRDNGVAREFEFAFQSALDPYSNTKVFLTFEDEEIGVEEGYLYWTGLPGRLRLDVGKFRQQIGDLNRSPPRATGDRIPAGVPTLPLPEAGGVSESRSICASECRWQDPDLSQGTGGETTLFGQDEPSLSSGCRTSGSSTEAPTPSSGSPVPAATTTTPIFGAGWPEWTSGSPGGRLRPAPAGRSRCGPRDTGCTPPRPGPPPTATAPSWTSPPG
jgi:hypothetical protein